MTVHVFFQEANKMVQDANVKRMNTEKLYKEAVSKVLKIKLAQQSIHSNKKNNQNIIMYNIWFWNPTDEPGEN